MSITIELSRLEIPTFQLDGAERQDPLSCLSSGRCKPLKRIYKSEPKILVLTPERLSTQEKIGFTQLINALITGVSGVRIKRWKGFSDIWGVELKIEYDTYEINPDGHYVSNLVKKLKQTSNAYDLFIIYLPEIRRSSLGGPYFKIKAFTMVNNIKEQIIIQPTVDKVNKYLNEGDFLKYNDLVWNLALSVFTKLGGIPWKLKDPMSPVDVFIAISTIIKPGLLGGKYRAGIAALQMYNNWGEYEDSIYGELLFVQEGDKGILQLGNRESEETFIEMLSTITRKVNGKNIVIHLTDLYAKRFHELLYEYLVGQGANSVKILRIQLSSPLRLYMNIVQASQAWPMVGTYWFLEPKKIAQLYTRGKWRYYLSRPPYAIPKHSIRPIQVTLEYPRNAKLTKDDLKDILWLTKLYPYMVDAPRTGLPIDLRLCSRYAQIVASNENVGIPEDITFLY